MRKRSFALVILSCMLLLAGCSGYARGPKFQPTESGGGKGLVSVYRPLISQFKAAAPNMLALYIDDERIGTMKIGGYARALLEPGQHTVQLRATLFFGLVPAFTENDAALTVEAGDEYYLRFERNIESINPELVALEELRRTRLIGGLLGERTGAGARPEEGNR